MHKLIKRYQLGGGLTSPTYTPTYNTGTDLYNNITNPNFNNINTSFINAIQPNLEFQSNLGDTTALGLSAISQLSQGLKSPINSESSKGVIGSSSGGKKGMSPKLQQGLQVAGQVVGATYDYIPTMDKTINNNDATMQNLRAGVNKGLMSSGNPYLMAAGLVNTGIDKLGGFTDASQGLGKKTDTINKIASLALPGAGWFAKRTDKYKMSDTLKENASAYGGTFAKGKIAQQNANAKLLVGRKKANYLISEVRRQDRDINDIMDRAYGGTFAKGKIAQQNANAKLLVGRKKANYLISEVRRQDRDINDIMDRAQDDFLASNNAQTIGLQNQMDLNGINWNRALRAKEGLKLDRNFAQQVIKLTKDKKNNAQNVQVDIIEFKNGGTFNVIPRAKEGLKLDRNFAQQVIKLTKDKKNNAQNVQVDIIEFKNGGTFNVIPSGALHAHKHHLEDVDEKFEEVTTKGIPVITENEEGIVQHAEVEKEEIIFNLEVTKQLEKLMQDGSDEAAIEAGKLLVHEILENTVDNTGLLNKIE